MSPAWQVVCIAAAFALACGLSRWVLVERWRPRLAERYAAERLEHVDLDAWIAALRSVSSAAAVAAQSMNGLGNRFIALGAAMPAARVVASTQPVERTIA